MIRLLLLLASLAYGSTETVRTDTTRLRNLSLDVRELQSGRARITGLPTFSNGMCFGDGSCQTTAGMPVGAIIAYASNTIPSGWLECNGVSYLTASYPQLYASIGCSWGCADATHFNVPDLRGRFLRGWDHTAGRDPDSADRTASATGGATGDNVGSVQISTFEAHAHGLYYQSYNAEGVDNIAAAQITGVPVAVTAEAGGDETRPINAYVVYIIRSDNGGAVLTSNSATPAAIAYVDAPILGDGTNSNHLRLDPSGTLPAMNGSYLTGLTESQISGLAADLANKVDLTETSSVTLRNAAFSVGISTLVVSDGKVAIGTTSTSGLLHVNSNGTASSGIVLRSQASDKFINYDLGRTSRDLAIGVAGINSDWSNGSVPGDTIIRAEGHNILFASGTVTHMYLSTAGYLGIGTTSPAATLDVNGSSIIQGQETVMSTLTVNGDAFSVGTSTFSVSNGKVGIGNTSPGLPLQVNGTSAYPNTSGTAQNGSLRIKGAVNACLDSGIISGGGAWLQATNATDLSLNYNLLLNPNGGNVGISTGSPKAMLDVNGDASFGSGAAKSTFTASGALSLAAGTGLTLSGAAGNITSASSVTASAFFGDGSHLTGIPSTGSISGVYLPLSGGTMTGQLTTTSTITVRGASGLGVTYGITAATMTATGAVTGGSFSGAGTGLTGTAASLTAGAVTTNANLTGPVTSVGNATTLVGPAAGEFTVIGTMTVQGNAFSVGASTLVVVNGKVGIGTTAPDTTLDVNGSIQVRDLILPTLGAGGILSYYPAGGSTYLISRNWVTGADRAFEVAASTFIVGTDNGMAMTILNNRNIGIGTSSPDTTLHVAGTVKITGGSPGTGKVLTSDSVGLASWSAAGTGDAVLAATQTFSGANTFSSNVLLNPAATNSAEFVFVSSADFNGSFNASLSVPGSIGGSSCSFKSNFNIYSSTTQAYWMLSFNGSLTAGSWNQQVDNFGAGALAGYAGSYATMGITSNSSGYDIAGGEILGSIEFETIVGSTVTYMGIMKGTYRAGNVTGNIASFLNSFQYAGASPFSSIRFHNSQTDVGTPPDNLGPIKGHVDIYRRGYCHQ